jgi:hypothetical protein
VSGYYDDNGDWHSEYDRPVDGYECDRCGHTPTISELNQGFCPGCRLNDDLATDYSERDTE